MYIYSYLESTISFSHNKHRIINNTVTIND